MLEPGSLSTPLRAGQSPVLLPCDSELSGRGCMRLSRRESNSWKLHPNTLQPLPHQPAQPCLLMGLIHVGRSYLSSVLCLLLSHKLMRYYKNPEVVVHEAWGLRAQEKLLDSLVSHVALLCQGPATGGGKLTEQSPFPICTLRLGCLHRGLSLMTNTRQDLEATNFPSPGHSLSSHPPQGDNV